MTHTAASHQEAIKMALASFLQLSCQDLHSHTEPLWKMSITTNI